MAATNAWLFSLILINTSMRENKWKEDENEKRGGK